LEKGFKLEVRELSLKGVIGSYLIYSESLPSNELELSDFAEEIYRAGISGLKKYLRRLKEQERGSRRNLGFSNYGVKRDPKMGRGFSPSM